MVNSKHMMIFTIMVLNIVTHTTEVSIIGEAYLQKAKKFFKEHEETIKNAAIATGVVGVFWGCYTW